MKATGKNARVGVSYLSTRTDQNYPLTRQARARGFASVMMSLPQRPWHDPDEYGRVSLSDLRAALDTLTLEDETAEVLVKLHGGTQWNWEHYRRDALRRGKNPPAGFLLSLDAKGRVRVKAPCGETFRYQVKTLDKALTALGA